MGMYRTRQRTFPTASAVWLGLLISLQGCAGLRRPGPEVDRSGDARITQEVQARLAAEPVLDAGRLRVSVDGGVVMLYGSVDGIGQWQCAIRNASMVPGVETVVDYLVIERGPREVECLAPRPPTTSGVAHILPRRWAGSPGIPSAPETAPLLPPRQPDRL